MLSLWPLKSSTVCAIKSTLSSSSQLVSMSGLWSGGRDWSAVNWSGFASLPILTSPLKLRLSVLDWALLPDPFLDRANTCCLWRFSMSMTLSTVQNAPVRPQPAEQWTNIGLACSCGSGPSCQLGGKDSFPSLFWLAALPRSEPGFTELLAGLEVISLFWRDEGVDASVLGTLRGGALRCITFASSTSARRWLGCAGAPKSGQDG